RIDATNDPDRARAELSHALHLTLPADFGVVTLLRADRVAPAGRAVRALDGAFVPMLALTLGLLVGAFAASMARAWTALGLGAGLAVAGSVAVVAASRVPARVVDAAHPPWTGTAD